MAEMVLRRVGMMSAAKWMTLAFFVLGIFAGIVYTASFVVYGQISGIVIIWYLLLTPILYAVVGLIASLIICVLYNQLNRALGGIVLELSDPRIGFELPPPPPKEWTDLPPSAN